MIAAPPSRREGNPRHRVLLLLLTLDFLLIGFAALYDRGILTDPRWSLARERGYAEAAQYVKFASAAALQFRHAFRRFELTPVLWGLLFVILLIDDAFEGHERAGLRLATLLPLPSIGKMHPSQVGELIVSGILGGSFFAALAWSLRTATPAVRAHSVALLAPLLLLGGFGVIADALHSLARGSWFAPALGYVEDGGELVAASLLLWVTWRVLPPEVTAVHAVGVNRPHERSSIRRHVPENAALRAEDNVLNFHQRSR